MASDVEESVAEVRPVLTTLYLVLMRLKAITAELAMIHDTLLELEHRGLSTKLKVAFGALKSALGDLEELVDMEALQDEVLKAVERFRRAKA